VSIANNYIFNFKINRMSFFNKIFGNKSNQKDEPIEFWKILPFNIFEIPDESYNVIEDGDCTTMDGEKLISYKGFKKSKSVHPWFYDSITIRYSISNKVGKTVNLTKSVDSKNLNRLFEFINWIASIYGEDDSKYSILTREEKLEIEDSLDNPDGFWMGRSWMNEKLDPKCGVHLDEEGKELTTTFWFSSKVS